MNLYYGYFLTMPETYSFTRCFVHYMRFMMNYILKDYLYSYLIIKEIIDFLYPDRANSGLEVDHCYGYARKNAYHPSTINFLHREAIMFLLH